MSQSQQESFSTSPALPPTNTSNSATDNGLPVFDLIDSLPLFHTPPPQHSPRTPQDTQEVKATVVPSAPTKPISLISRLKLLKQRIEPTRLFSPTHTNQNSSVDPIVAASLHGTQYQWNVKWDHGEVEEEETEKKPVAAVILTKLENKQVEEDSQTFLQNKILQITQHPNEFTEHDEDLMKWLRRKRYRLTPYLKQSKAERALVRKEKRLKEQLDQVQKKRVEQKKKKTQGIHNLVSVYEEEDLPTTQEEDEYADADFK